MTLYRFENGKIIAGIKKEPFVNIREGALTGDKDPLTLGVFTTILVKDQVPVFIDEHLRRLLQNAKEIGLNIKEENKIKKLVNKIIRMGDEREHGIRSVLWNLYDTGFNIDKDFGLYPFNLHFSPEDYYGGVCASLAYSPRERPEIKSVNWSRSFDAEELARKRGTKEAIIYNDDENICEGARSNVFWVYNGKLETPSKGMLRGITRSKLLDLCKIEGIPVTEGTFSKQRMLEADEVFVTGTTKRILPVVKIDKKIIGNGKPGKLTRFLMDSYQKLVESYISSYKSN